MAGTETEAKTETAHAAAIELSSPIKTEGSPVQTEGDGYDANESNESSGSNTVVDVPTAKTTTTPSINTQEVSSLIAQESTPTLTSPPAPASTPVSTSALASIPAPASTLAPTSAPTLAVNSPFIFALASTPASTQAPAPAQHYPPSLLVASNHSL